MSVLSLYKWAVGSVSDQWWAANTCFTELSVALGKPLWLLEDLFDSQKILRKFLCMVIIDEGEQFCSKYLKLYNFYTV